MRLFALVAASVVVLGSAAAQAEPRSLSLSGVDQKLPGSLGKAAEAPKVVQAPRPPEPPRAEAAPAPAVAAPAAPAAAAAAPPPPAQAAEPAPAYVQRPSLVGTKPAENREGQVTFDETRPAAPGAAVAPESAKPAKTEQAKTEQAKADKPRRKRAHWDEARIMREIYRYGGYAGMLGGW